MYVNTNLSVPLCTYIYTCLHICICIAGYIYIYKYVLYVYIHMYMNTYMHHLRSVNKVGLAPHGCNAGVASRNSNAMVAPPSTSDW